MQTVTDGLSVAEQVARRDQRYEALRALWDVSRLKRIQGCSRRRISTGQGVPIVVNEDRAHFSNLQRCGSIWGCPVCAPKILSGRTGEVEGALLQHAGQGGTIALLTFTLPHSKRRRLRNGRHVGDKLSKLLDLVAGGFSAMLSGRAWAGTWKVTRHDVRPSDAMGSPRWVPDTRVGAGPCDLRPEWFIPGDRDRFGVVGTIRAMEITHGANGWHPHLHVLVLLDGNDDNDDRVTALGESIEGRWCDWIEAQGHKRPLPGIAVDAQRVVHPEQAARYALGVAFEVTRQDLKIGRRAGRTPWQILDDFRTTGDTADLKLWREYERATKGRQCVTWSAGLKARYAVEEVTDQEHAEEEVGGDVIGVVPASSWKRITRKAGALGLLLRGAELAGAHGVLEALSLLGVERHLDPPPPRPRPG